MIWVTQTINVILSSLTIWISALIIMARWKFVLIKKEENILIIYINILLIVLLFAFSTNNIIMFYILFEASLIPTFIIILGWGYQPERLEATNYLIIYTIFASLPLLLSILIITNCTGSISIIIKRERIISINSYWWIIIIMAFLVKTPIYLTHLWLPKAHVEAPVAGSIRLAAILLKLGRYGLIIISKYNIIANNKIIFIISSLRLWGALISGLICIRQTDLKSLIAYSSIRHIALVTASILTNNLWGWRGAFILILAHGLCSSSIFNYANIVADISSSRRIYLNKGIIALTPSITIWWFLIRAINIGAPPSINLIREIIIIISIMSSTIYLILYLALVRFMTAAYNLIIYTSTSHGNKIIFLLPRNNINHRSYLINFIHIIPLLGLISSPKFISLFI
jgi:NADH-ubiquinone oxidoreductase chain 4